MSTTGPEAQTVNAPPAGTYEIDPAHTSLEFVARHLMTKVRGRFAYFSGVAEITGDPATSHVEVEVDVASVDTRQPQRDGHLKSADFFDVEHHPKITFKSTGIRPGEAGTWKLDGDLTVRGVTRPITLDVEFLGMAVDPFGNTKAGFEATTEVNREDWGLNWNAALETGGFLLAKTVRLEIEAQLIKKQ